MCGPDKGVKGRDDGAQSDDYTVVSALILLRLRKKKKPRVQMSMKEVM
jgi:hypothetical protein